MPNPRAGESKDDYIERCVPVVIADGTAEDGSQARAVCENFWENRNNPRLGAIAQQTRMNAARRRKSNAR